MLNSSYILCCRLYTGVRKKYTSAATRTTAYNRSYPEWILGLLHIIVTVTGKKKLSCERWDWYAMGSSRFSCMCVIFTWSEPLQLACFCVALCLMLLWQTFSLKAQIVLLFKQPRKSYSQSHANTPLSYLYTTLACLVLKQV